MLAILWKVPVVAVAFVLGAFGANQAGWSGAELVVNLPLMGPIEDFVTGAVFSIGTAVSAGAFIFVQRIAKPALWLMVPIQLYCGLVLGTWNGFWCDFDATRLEVLKHHYANGYALEHMGQRALYRSCNDAGVELAEDAKAVCARKLHAAPGEAIPGSEHRCGLLGMFSCFDTAPRK